MVFKNLPTDTKKEKTPKPPTSTKANKNATKTVISSVIKIFVVIAVVAFFGWKAFDGVQSVIKAKDELFFAFQHPQLVKPVRELYTLSHQKADEDLKQILNGGKE